jgi:GNAT superfamily N-acetyltransferase
MLTCERNPAAFAETYLKNLNTAFGSWGNTELYEWVFQRECGSFAPEQLILRDESNEVLAGSGVSYRRLILPNGNAMDVGIMTGSWTLPAARGRGCFTRIIEESRLLCADRGCGLLLAFVTQDNPSRRALERAGSALFPSRYVFGTVEDSPSSAM